MKIVSKKDFALPVDQTYMCGHSLGPQPLRARARLTEGLEAWAKQAIAAWNESGWIDLPQSLGAKLASIIGAQADEVIVSDNTTINILKVLLNALDLNPRRSVVLTEKENFPADLYIADSLPRFRSSIVVRAVSSDSILSQLSEDVAVLLLTHVNYRTSQIYDLESITRRAHELGILTIWDLSHSVGAVPLNCDAHDVDFAVGCTYKYLNGGPGAPGFLYVNRRHLTSLSPAIHGWMGHKRPFAFEARYEASLGVTSLLTGTPPILSYLALDGALDIFSDLDLIDVYRRSRDLAEELRKRVIDVPMFRCVSPRNPKERGCHLAYFHPNAYAFSRALIANGVVIDYREPGIIRFGISSLYCDMDSVSRVVETIAKITTEKLYLQPQFQIRPKVV